MSWTAIQLGSREHYAIPIALYDAGRLDFCVTDTWLSRTAALLARRVSPSLSGRRSEKLPDTVVKSNTVGRIITDLRLRHRKESPWSATLQRNNWFGRWAAEKYSEIGSKNVFSYAYTARRAFREAKRVGARCILGQIDPGPSHYEAVGGANLRYSGLSVSAAEPPPEYWEFWREEIHLADHIVVNSKWSATLLLQAGVPASKIVEIPLVYERAHPLAEKMHSSGRRCDGPRHSKRRLRVLFLGSISIAKGAGQTFDAIRLLRRDPVDFVFAGPLVLRVPDDIRTMPNVRFLGAVDRAAASRLYRESDVFLFPTLSDGFGLTQLEALGHGLPVIASTYCALVVEDKKTGLLLPEVTPGAIAEYIMRLARDRDLLEELSSNAQVPDKYHPRHLAPALLSLEKA